MWIRDCWLISAFVACCACKGHDASSPPSRDNQPGLAPTSVGPAGGAETALAETPDRQTPDRQTPAQPSPGSAPAPDAGPDELHRRAEQAAPAAARADAAARQAVTEATRAQATVDQIRAELAALGTKLDQLTRSISSSTTDAERAAALAQLDEISKLRIELQRRIAAAKAAAAAAQRASGIPISKACRDNPLAAGCS
jgi:hypothetical protein